MAKTPRAGELTTANYGWTKPTVGASVDVWGDQININLDGIDSVVNGIQTSVPAASTTPPLMDGTAAIGAATKWAKADHVHPTDTSRASVAYVDAKPVAIGDNRIINGDMRIDQRNNGASGTAISYTVDRWNYVATQPGKMTWQQIASGSVGFPYALSFTIGTAYALLAGDTFLVNQPIEADAISDLAWGTANAQPVTLSFWVASSLTGTFSGAISNYGNSGVSTRSYPFTFSIPTANTWARIVITVPGDKTGTGWLMSGNGVGAYLRFDLGSGATWRAPANVWGAGNIVGANGAVSLVATQGAVYQLTGVKLEIGSVATPFNRQSLAKSMADCQRYYQTGKLLWGGQVTSGAVYYVTSLRPVFMRAASTMAVTSNGSTLFGTPTLADEGTDFFATATASATGAGSLSVVFSASAEL